MRPIIMRRLSLLALFFCLLTACGIKGGLYLPAPLPPLPVDHSKVPSPAQSQPTAAQSDPKATQ